MSTRKQALIIGGQYDGEISDDLHRVGYARHEIKTPFKWTLYVHHSLDLDQAMLKLITGYKPTKPNDQ